MIKTVLFISLIIRVFCFATISGNQTDALTPVLQPDSLPFKISIVLSDFQLPSNSGDTFGVQSVVSAIYQGKWLFFSGRTNGLHGFLNGSPDNFPPRLQNTNVYVVDPNKQRVSVRSLASESAGLSQSQIDSLSVTAAEYYQVKNTLYMVGGYGVDTATGLFSTKSILTAIDIPALIDWVENDSSKKSAAQCIRQTSHPLLQVTGGYLTQENPHAPFLLILGQNFDGYYSSSISGIYTEQVRPFQIIDNGNTLYVQPMPQYVPNPNYRRRDLNVVPIIQKGANSYDFSYVALSGVFTEAGGVWTVPILINSDGTSFMPDSANSNTFMQGMNNYISARASLFSKKTGDMYTLLFGGISYETYSDGSFSTSSEDPFTNNVTTIKIDASGNFSQYIMEGAYPFIPAEFGTQISDPPLPLLFGASARFFPVSGLPLFPNDVFSLDSLGSTPVLLGYIVGGIQSSVPNTGDITDSAASPYIFSVILERR